jgi:hypothetical protein
VINSGVKWPIWPNTSICGRYTVGTFQIVISVTKYSLFYTKTVIIYFFLCWCCVYNYIQYTSSGEYDVCDVTLSVYPQRASLKNMP